MVFRGHSRTNTRTAKSPREIHGLSRTVLVREFPIGLSAIGLLRKEVVANLYRVYRNLAHKM